MKSFRHFCSFGLMLLCSIPLSAEWHIQNNGTGRFDSGIAIDACDTNTVVCLVYDSTAATYFILRTTNGGRRWQRSICPVAGYDIEMIDSLIMLIPAEALYRTENGGQSWTQVFSDTLQTKKIFYIETFDGYQGIAAGDCLDDPRNSLVVLSSENYGRGWISVNDSAFGGTSYNSWRDIDFVDPELGYFSPVEPKYSIYKTTDACKTWTKTTFRASSRTLCLKFFSDLIGIACDWNGIKRTTNGGETWEEMPSGGPFTYRDIEFVPVTPAKIWMIGRESLFCSADTGRSWSAQVLDGFGETAGNPGQDLVFADARHAWLLSDTCIYHTNDSGKPTVIAEPPAVQSNEFQLLPAYPNPFNATATIVFRLPQPDEIEVSVFDIMGQRVDILCAQQHYPAGRHMLHWQPDNISSGIYLIQLTNGLHSHRQKILFLK